MSLPRSLAIVEDESSVSELLAEHFECLRVRVASFANSEDLITCTDPYGFEFYLIDILLPGIDGIALTRLLRRRTRAGIIVVTARTDLDAFAQAMAAGADMFLAKPVGLQQVELSVAAVHRRVVAAGPPTAAEAAPWRLSERRRRLISPEGVEISLSDTDLIVMRCFVEAPDRQVSRAHLRVKLGGQDHAGDNWLNATMYRLRRRIEAATRRVAPLQSRPRVGYVFRAKIVRA